MLIKNFKMSKIYGFDNYEELLIKRNSIAEDLCKVHKIKKFTPEIDRTLFTNKKFKTFVHEYKHAFLLLNNQNTECICELSNKKLNTSDKLSPLYPVVQPAIPIQTLFLNKISPEHVIENKLVHVIAQSLQFDRYICYVE